MSRGQAMKSRGLLNPPFLFMYCLGKDGARVSPRSREIGTKTPGGGWERDSVATGNPIPHGFDQKKAPREAVWGSHQHCLALPPGSHQKGSRIENCFLFFENKAGEQPCFSCCSHPVQASVGTSHLLLTCSSLLILLISPFPGASGKLSHLLLSLNLTKFPFSQGLEAGSP